MLVQKKYNPFVLGALKEILTMRLAHFSVLPVYINYAYNSEDLIKTIKNSIVINEPDLWLQTQAGRLFLKAYYGKLLVPNSNFNYKKSIDNKFFANYKIRNYVSYFYFDECLVNTLSPYSNAVLLNEFKKFKVSYKFTPEELESLNTLSKRISLYKVSVMDDFMAQDLEDLSGKKLTIEEKKAIIADSNIIIDYWASWCIPCRAKMDERNNNLVKIGATNYKIIFISIDEYRLNWLKAK